MNWAEILEEKNKLIEELQAKLAEAEAEIEWTFNRLKPPLEMVGGNKLPAIREVRQRLAEYLDKGK